MSPEMRAVRDEEGQGYSEALGRLLSDLEQSRGTAQIELGLAVKGLTALLDGLWLQLCLDPSSIRPKDAATLCGDWVDRVLAPKAAR